MKRKAALITSAVLGIAVIVFLIFFIQQYQTLGNTIEKERITYVSEIKNQLVENITMEKDIQMSLAELYSNIIAKAEPKHFSDVKDLLDNVRISEKDSAFLLGVDGTTYDLDGKRKNLSDNVLIQNLLVDKQPVFSYVQVNNREEYWVYGETLDRFTLDGIEIEAILSAREIHNFSKHMATGILNNEGFSYVSSKNGNVLVYPSEKSDIGYNLFRSLRSLGAEKSMIEQMEVDFSQGRGGQEFLSYGGNRWLISYSSDIFDDWVVVILMPMTITAADTYQMLNRTLTAVLLLVGSILALMFLLLNLFYRKERARERAVQQERMRLEVANRTAESKNEFLAKMSHDIRTPLNAIMGLLKMTEGLVKGQPKVEGNLGKVKQSAEYLLSILNDILDMSKIESGKMQIDSSPFLLHELLKPIEAINMAQAESKNVDFRIEVQGNVDICYLGDRLRLNQILMNLLSNAVKFTDAGGSVTLSLNVIPEKEGVDLLKFVVEDTGIGMSGEFLQNIFQPFEQESASVALNYSGSGLGLSIVKNLVDLMDGEIHVASTKGKGSRFEINLKLPRAKQPQDNVKEQEQIPDVLLEGGKLLLAEDNELNAMIASELIKGQFGMQVDIAEDGQIAVERFTAGGEDEYVAILMDIRMPVMDGLAATRAIRGSGHKRAESIPIIAMSANAFEEDAALSLESGMNEHLAKPIDIERLEKILKLWIAKERGGVE